MDWTPLSHRMCGRGVRSYWSFESGMFDTALEWIGNDAFARHHFGQQPLLLRRDGAHDAPPCVSWHDFDDVLGDPLTTERKHIEVTKPNGRFLDYESQANAAGVHATRILQQAMDAGATVYLRQFPLRFQRTRALVRRIEQARDGLSAHDTQAFISVPGHNSGLHADEDHSFVFMLLGRKRWRVYAERAPVGQRGAYDGRTLLTAPVIDTVLEAGDVLYFPPRCYHLAEAVTPCALLSIGERRSSGSDFVKLTARHVRRGCPALAHSVVPHLEAYPAWRRRAQAILTQCRKMVCRPDFQPQFHDAVESARRSEWLQLPAHFAKPQPPQPAAAIARREAQ